MTLTRQGPARQGKARIGLAWQAWRDRRKGNRQDFKTINENSNLQDTGSQQW
jgi:hypothetical protein